MSSSKQSSRRTPTVMMLAAALGALVILVVSMVLNWPMGSGATSGSGQFGSAPAPEVAFETHPGECLNWTEPDASDISKVTCGERHLFEAAGSFDLTKEFGRQAPYPDAQQWQQLKQQRCAEVTNQYLQGKLDPHGRFSVGAFTPSKDGWDNGDRTLHCGLQQPGPSGKLFPTEGSATQIDQSDVYPAGRCLGINGTEIWDPVDCAQEHGVEISGIVNLADQFKAGYPTEGDQDGFLAAKCQELTAAYAGGPTTAKDKGLVVFWDTKTPESWNAGSRQVNCKLGALLPDGSGLAPVTGSVKGTVRIANRPAAKLSTPTEPGAPATAPR